MNVKFVIVFNFKVISFFHFKESRIPAINLKMGVGMINYNKGITILSNWITGPGRTQRNLNLTQLKN